jgi:hypothetical protein
VLHGVGNIGDSGANNQPLRYPAMLQDLRGFNWGGVGMPFNHAASGANSSNVLTLGGAVDQLAGQVAAGDVTLALMSVGDNDWFPVVNSIATGALSGPALTAFENNLVANIETGVNRVLAAGGSVVLGGFSNIVDSPALASIAANAIAKGRVEGALAAADNQLIAYAAANGIPFIDFFNLEKSVYDSGSFVVGGVNINLHTFGPDPHNFFQSTVDAGVVIRAEIANLWIQGINEAHGTGIPLLSDLEILTLAGLQNEYVHETFSTATNFSDFTEFTPAPEPSSFLLVAIGASLVALFRRRMTRPR